MQPDETNHRTRQHRKPDPLTWHLTLIKSISQKQTTRYTSNIPNITVFLVVDWRITDAASASCICIRRATWNDLQVILYNTEPASWKIVNQRVCSTRPGVLRPEFVVICGVPRIFTPLCSRSRRRGIVDRQVGSRKNSRCRLIDSKRLYSGPVEVLSGKSATYLQALYRQRILHCSLSNRPPWLACNSSCNCS